MCLYPKLIKNKKYTSNKKNGGIIPPVIDQRVTMVPVGCGNCIECRKKKSREWQARLHEDIKENRNGKFITFTFSDKSIHELSQYEKTYIDKYGNKKKFKINTLKGYDLDNEIATVAVYLFRNRWRKEFGKSIRHWLVTELGHQGTENIHLHGIVWTNETLEKVEEKWQYGHVWKGKHEMGKLVNYVNEKTVNYIVKYITKVDTQHQYYKGIVLTSPGVGKAYTDKTIGDWKNNIYKPNKTMEAYRTRQGNKIALPIYFRNKIYTEDEREKLWLEKLDKQERWILGQKISIKNGEEQYWRDLKSAQRINRELGYGNDEKNWEQEQYERDKRILMQNTRIKRQLGRNKTKTTDS